MFNKINAKRFRAGPKRYYEQGVLDIELVAYIPILVLITLFFVQGFFAVSAVTSVSAAARNGARAEMLGHSPEIAIQKSLPDWVKVRSISNECGTDRCLKLTASVPIGIPNIMQKNVEVTRVALFPRD